MPPVARIKQVFLYNKYSGLLVYRTFRSRFLPGTIAGWKDQKGYIQCKIDGRSLKAHRVIWTMIHGPIPEGMQIDHKNGKRDDNRLANLRLVTGTVNAHNRATSRNSTSGYSGVVWRKARATWEARIRINGRVKILGSFKDKRLAIEARKAAELRMGYIQRKGRPRKAAPVVIPPSA